tara:strand:+ start:1067 stop:1399 length:333 start_codon:yes stop_codon:yes gene_type:complete
MNPVLEFFISVFIVTGAAFILVGSIGLARLSDFYQRLHGPTKATTLGVGGIIVGSLLFFSWRQQTVHLQEILVVVFLFITAPVSAHMLAKAAMHRDTPRRKDTRGEPWEQ